MTLAQLMTLAHRAPLVEDSPPKKRKVDWPFLGFWSVYFGLMTFWILRWILR